jgi:hypothetical protein
VNGNPVNFIDSQGLFNTAPYQNQWAQDRFNKWYDANRDVSWTNSLPSCPDKIKVECGEPKNCTRGNWGSLNKANQTYHPGAKWCMRSKGSSGSAQQCCYNSDGNLIISGLGAGTPDKQCASATNWLYLNHYYSDVRAFNDAWKLDRGVQGDYLTKYLEVRPPSQGGGICY